jgi:hypothetical protein
MAISIKSPLRKKRNLYRQLRWCEPWPQEVIDRLKKEREEMNQEIRNYIFLTPPPGQLGLSYRGLILPQQQKTSGTG